PANFRSSGLTARSSQTMTATRVRSCPARMSHACNAWSARARPRVSTLICYIELTHEVRHLERSKCGIPSLVSVLSAATCHRLLHRIARQQSKPEWNFRIARRVGETARRFTGYEIEVRGVAANDGAQCNDCFITIACHCVPSGERKLPCTRHPHDVDVIERNAMTHERVESAVNQRPRNCFIEPADDDGDTTSGTNRVSRDFSHSGTQKVSELIALRVEIIRILFGLRRNYRNAVFDLQSITLEPDQLARIVRERPNFLEAEVEKNLRANSIVAKIGLETELFICLDRV